MRDVLRAKGSKIPAAVEMRTIIYGLGAQKAGTTWLYRYFRNHPQVHVPPAKELHYWTDVRWPYGREGRNRARRAVRDEARVSNEVAFHARRVGVYRSGTTDHTPYLHLLGMGAGASLALADISPSYANLTAETFREMVDVAPRARFVFVMRDPVDRLWAGLRHHLRYECGRFDTEALMALWAREKATGVANGEKFSRYDRTLGALDAAGLIDRLHPVFYEEMFTAREIDRLCDALGLDRWRACFDVKVNVNPAGARTMPVAFRDEARSRLAVVYDECAARFGRLPDTWCHGAAGRADAVNAECGPKEVEHP